jgi:glucosylglycerate synthase
MTETQILPAESPAPATGPAPVEFAVGIASHNNAETIGLVLQAVQTGLRRAFPQTRTVIIHVDGGSVDGTPGLARQAVPSEEWLIQLDIPPESGPDRAGSSESLLRRPAALRSIFEQARSLHVRGLAVLEANVTSMTPEWIERLTGPIVRSQADFVAPYFARHRFDGAVTKAIAYPLTRALYGKRLRFPLAGEFGCSARLLDHYLARNSWPAELARYGCDVWLVDQALAGGFRIAQAFLGVRTQTGSDGADLGERQVKVLGALFIEVERNAAVWQKIRGSESVPLYGQVTSAEVEPAVVDAKRALDSFRLGQKNLSEVWGLVLPPASLLGLRKLAQLPDGELRFPDELWARTVYDFALAHRTRIMHRDHLLSAFTPLFMGWLGSYVTEMQDADPSRIEQRLEQLCLRYEAEKPYFISRWRWPDRFNP